MENKPDLITGAQFRVRPLEDKDLDRVCQMEEASFSMPWKREDFKELIESEASSYLVLLLDDYVIGTAGYTDQVGEGYVNNVVIDETYRGKGYSKILMQAVIDDALSHDIKDLTLEVRVSNEPAVRLYESLGFESAGIRKRFYEHPVEDAYVMWRRG